MFIFLTSANENAEKDFIREEALLLLVANGNKEALSELYGLTKSSVYGFALSILKNTHDAEDILQNSFVKVWQNAPSYKASGKPMAWILTITKNLCLMKIRDNKKLVELEPAIENSLSSPDNTSKAAEDKAILETALKCLNDDERQIVMLHAVSGMKFREIALVLNMVTATVLSKYHRAIGKMKKLLEE